MKIKNNTEKQKVDSPLRSGYIMNYLETLIAAYVLLTNAFLRETSLDRVRPYSGEPTMNDKKYCHRKGRC